MTAQQSSELTSVTLPDAITVKGLSERLGISPVEVIKRLMTHGVMAAMNDTIDYETAALVSSELGIAPSPEAAPQAVAAVIRSDEEQSEDGDPRPPIVAILGHVDHGKTSLLDSIRETNVVAGEAGGITQHIGAYQIERGGKPITFIDTPGHAAFTAMRARGAQITDVAIVVVAADDGVMPQTIEAINHVRAAEVPMIIAINKSDLPAANPDRVKQQLTEQSVVVEDYGGDVLAVPVSATTGAGLDDLLESIDLVAEIQELKASTDSLATGTVVEAELDSRRGPVATVLIANGTLRQGDALVSGLISGKVKAMFDERGDRLSEAGPSRPVRIMGLEDVPAAGDAIEVIESERSARRIVEEARREAESSTGVRHGGLTLETLFNEVGAGNVKELLLILKTDVRGTAEAIRGSLQGLGTGEVKIKVIHTATGSVSESDVMLADASGAIILAFNVRTEPSAASQAETNGVEIRTYDVIYQLIESVDQALEGLYEPIYERIVDGVAEVRQLFRSSRVGQIAGCYVTEGTLLRGDGTRVLRDGQEVADTNCAGLRRFQDDVREVQQGFECGVVLEQFDNFQEGDLLEFYHQKRVN
ncbi:MAG: translation initiation factor IF-2 [Dehalococcoidia bacterium]|nr:translation initiation factor IF-2 [Dehalococcoidia bacterium]|tara:strand:- start:640 stop:2409 length:1770 start_codon:yes stop_codon:yes gene_type:complete